MRLTADDICNFSFPSPSKEGVPDLSCVYTKRKK